MEYPLFQNPGAGYVEVDNIWQYRAELEACSPDLFVSESSDVDLELLALPTREEAGSLSVQPEGIPEADLVDPFRRLTIRSGDELKATVKNEETNSKTCIFLISQRNSWSRLRITHEMFKSLCAGYEIFPRFLDIVFGFGKKHSSVDECFVGCYARLMNPGRTQEEETQKSFQICYDLRYYEHHGRDLEDPWSCRRSAIYQKFIPEEQRSLWILIQAPGQFKQELLNLLTRSPGLRGHPMALHLRYLMTCGKNWRMFLSHINEQLSLLDRKTAFPGKYKEFGVDFAVIQRLQSMRCQLNQARSIIATTIDITTAISGHSTALQSLADVSPTLEQAFQNELRQVILDLRNYTRMVEEMFGFSEDIRLMTHKILEFWNGDLIHENGLSLRQLAFSEATERKLLSQFAEETSKDSKRMKIATFIGTCYLPTNLVLTFFSTGLVRYDNGKGGITIRAQSWIAVVMSVILIGVTFGAATYSYRWRRFKQSNAGTSVAPP